jgi:NAD(P) transhydrogenase subunit alpha
MKIGILKEAAEGETRVALIPSAIAALKKKNHEVIVQKGAGEKSFISDEAYAAQGATLVATAADVLAAADVLLKVRPPLPAEAEALREGTALIGFLSPFAQPELIKTLARRKITAFSMEYIPRITRAQSMDALSSMASLAGYKAVIVAADRLGRILPMMATAAGTIAPTSVLVLGAGVAGLQAIATAKRLGARVEAFDPRPVVKEQVESVGATFIAMETAADAQTAGGYAKEQSEDFLNRERQAIAARLPKTEVVVTTALIFGKPAPLLITEDMLKTLPGGAVVIDLAAEQGGNCALTKPDEWVEKYGVAIYGPTNLATLLPVNASQVYSKNTSSLFDYLYGKGDRPLNFEDEIAKGACLTHGGEIRNEAVKKLLEG